MTTPIRAPKVGDDVIYGKHGRQKILQIESHPETGGDLWASAGFVMPGGRQATISWEGPLADLVWDPDYRAWIPK